MNTSISDSIDGHNHVANSKNINISDQPRIENNHQIVKENRTQIVKKKAKKTNRIGLSKNNSSVAMKDINF